MEEKKIEIQRYLMTLKYYPIETPKKSKVPKKSKDKRRIGYNFMCTGLLRNFPRQINQKRVLHSRIGTGFESFFYGLEAACGLGKFLLSRGMKCFYTHRVSQDHLEQFFSAVRGRNGYNSRPSPRLFMAAYRALLLNAQIKISNGNTELLDALPVINLTPKIQGKLKKIHPEITKNRFFCSTRS